MSKEWWPEGEEDRESVEFKEYPFEGYDDHLDWFIVCFMVLVWLAVATTIINFC